MTTQADTEQTIARLRRTLLLLAQNQETQQQREAAGRHLDLLYAAMLAELRAQEAAASVRLDQPDEEEGEEGTYVVPWSDTHTGQDDGAAAR